MLPAWSQRAGETVTPGTESTAAVWSEVREPRSAVSRPMSGRVNRGTGGASPRAYPGTVVPAEAEADAEGVAGAAESAAPGLVA